MCIYSYQIIKSCNAPVQSIVPGSHDARFSEMEHLSCPAASSVQPGVGSIPDERAAPGVWRRDPAALMGRAYAEERSCLPAFAVI